MCSRLSFRSWPAQAAIRQGHLSLVPPPAPSDLEALLVRLSHLAPRRVWLAAALRRDWRDARRLAQFKGLSAITGVPLLATMDALYASPAQRPLQDVLGCIREEIGRASCRERVCQYV